MGLFLYCLVVFCFFCEDLSLVCLVERIPDDGVDDEEDDPPEDSSPVLTDHDCRDRSREGTGL